MRPTDLISGSFNSSLISPNNSSSAVISVLKEMMEGLGWQDMSADIYQAEAEHELANQKLATAVKYYLETNDTHSRAQLMKALNEKLTEIQSEYDHAIKQQKYHEEQAKIEAEQKTTNSSSYLSQWSHWVFDGIKTFFGSTTEQQIEKYCEIASNQKKIKEEISNSLQILLNEQFSNDSMFNADNNHSKVQQATLATGYFPSIFNLTTLNNQTGFKMEINSPGYDIESISISGAGDSNGDGYDDIIIGTYSYSSCYIIFGRPNIGTLNVLNLTNLNGTNGFIINGVYQGQGAGRSVGGKGDVNGDNLADFAIGVLGVNAAYIVYGTNKFRATPLSLSSLNGTNGITFYGNIGDSGSSVRIINDINDDKYSEFLIGVSFSGIQTKDYAYVVFGQNDLASIADQGVIFLDKLNGTYGFKLSNKLSNIETGYRLGKVVSGLGDVNGDGRSDFIIGAPSSRFSNFSSAAYVIFGVPPIDQDGFFDLSQLDGSNGFKIIDDTFSPIDSINCGMGKSVSDAGDVNGDGYSDLIIGTNDYECSCAYVIFGGPTIGRENPLYISNLNGKNGFKIQGELNANAGYSVSSGNFNGDKYSDLFIGAPYGNSIRDVVSNVYILFGSPNIGRESIVTLNNLNGNGTTGFRMQDQGWPILTGSAVSDAGDINVDGVSDMLIANPYNNEKPIYSIYVVFGDIPPVLINNSFILYRGERMIINFSNLAAFDRNHLNESLIFDLTNLNYGSFENINQPGISILNFTQLQVQNYQIQFIHDGSYNSPFFSTKVRSSGIAWTGPSPAEIIFNSMLIVLANNELSIYQDQTIQMTTENFLAICNNISDPSLTFIITNLTHGFFTINDRMSNLSIISFPQQAIFDKTVAFIHDGSPYPPSYKVSVADPWIQTDPVPAQISFNAVPMVLVKNILNINQTQTVLLTSENMLATRSNIANPNFVFVITNITYGHFNSSKSIQKSPVINITQQQILDDKIFFTQDGSPYSPSYQVSVYDGWVQTDSEAADILFTADKIVLVNNKMIINQTQSVILSSNNLLAWRNNIVDPSLIFLIRNITHGSFLINGNLSLSSQVSISQQAIETESVIFMQDGSQFSPSYQVSVTDPWIQMPPMPAQISFNSVPFFLVNNQLSIKQNQTLLLDSKNLMATRNDIAVASFTFVVTNIAHGIFNINGQTSASQISFAQQAILSAHVSFVQDGSRSAPSYAVSVSDGWNQTIPTLANISFLLKPLLSINQFLVSLNQSTLLSLNNICANDCYEESADNLQFKILGTTENGQFESMQNVGKPISQFTQKNIKQGDIRFVSNGVSKAPRYQLSVTDPVSELSDTLQGSTLLVTRNYLRIDQGSQFELSAEYLAVTSSNGKDDDIIFTPVQGSVQHGFFSLTSNPTSPVATFKQGQINNKQVLFVPDDSGSEPSCILSVRESQPQGASGSFPCQIDFASFPRLDHAFLKIAPPDSFPLTTGNLEASDDRVTADKLYFLVSEVKNDHFAYSSNFEFPITNFTQLEINNGRVYFIAKTTEPPEFKVSVWNGRLFCQNCPKPADIVAPSMGGDSSNSLWIGLLSGLATLVLLPLLKSKLESGLKSYFSSRENTVDSQIANAALARLWLGCCGVITRSQYEAYARAFGQVVDELSDAKQLGQVPLREKWPHLSDRVQGEIKSQIAEESERILVGSQSSVCRFFKSLCRAEATPADIESKAVAIARAVRPSMPGLFAKSAQDLRLRVTREEDMENKNESLRTPLLGQLPNGGKEPISLSSFS